MRHQQGKMVKCVLVGVCHVGCGGSDIPTLSYGTEDSGIMAPEVDLPPAGEPDVPLPTGECVQIPEPGAFGYWHQCYGELELTFTATYNNKQYTGGDLLRFGEGVTNPDYWSEPDSYDLPLVAACCGPFDYPNPTTEEKIPYVNNCLYDAMQQICIGLPHFLRKQAQETNLGDGKLALEWLADKIEANAEDCRASLWAGGPPGPNGQNFNEISGTSWAPPNTPALITIVRSEVYDWTEAADMPELTPCFGIYDNDTAVVPTAPINVPGVVGGSDSISAQDGSAMGYGPFLAEASFVLPAGQSVLTVARDTSGAPVVTRLTLEAAPSIVTIAGERGELERARLMLAAPLYPAYVAGEQVVAPGAAVFTAALNVAGDVRVVSLVNADAIVMREQAEQWQLDPFELAYDELGIGVWTVSVDGLDFRVVPTR